MKQSIVKIFTFSLLVSSISFISCVDNEKNLFNADQLKQIYEETFSAKNRHKAQRKAKFYINKCRSASCMQSGLKQASA